MKALLNPIGWLVALGLVSATLLLVGCKNERPVQVGTDVVMSVKSGGHGSGVHLGGGYFITASHVAEHSPDLTIIRDDGEQFEGTVLWNNVGYDVALVYVEGYDGPKVNLSCAPVYVGQRIRIMGNPFETKFASSWGRISSIGKTGYEQDAHDKRWKRIVTADITAAPGVSGGAVYDEETGDLVGILVAGMITPRGAFAYSFIVPGDAICHVFAVAAIGRRV